jgi:hypothetical protein
MKATVKVILRLSNRRGRNAEMLLPESAKELLIFQKERGRRSSRNMGLVVVPLSSRVQPVLIVSNDRSS